MEGGQPAINVPAQLGVDVFRLFWQDNALPLCPHDSQAQMLITAVWIYTPCRDLVVRLRHSCLDCVCGALDLLPECIL